MAAVFDNLQDDQLPENLRILPLNPLVEDFRTSLLTNTEYLDSLDEDVQPLFLNQIMLLLLKKFYELYEPRPEDNHYYVNDFEIMQDFITNLYGESNNEFLMAFCKNYYEVDSPNFYDEIKNFYALTNQFKL